MIAGNGQSPESSIWSGAGGAVGGAVIGGLINAGFQREANSSNWHHQQEMFREQKYLMNTAHQREVEDLKAAGINPILSAGGQGSQTPQGGSSTMVAPQIDMPGIIAAMQNQQRIDIDKASAAAAITKNLTSAELDKTNKAVAEGGFLSRWLGTGGATIQQKLREAASGAARDYKPKWNQPSLPNPLYNKQPSSSGGSLP